MSNVLIVKLVVGQDVSKQDVIDELWEICDREHGNCNAQCPVYELNGDQIPWNSDSTNCVCFKNGLKMFDFIEEKNI